MRATEEEREAEATREYTSAVHAMQSGVMVEMTARLNTAHEPKQLRVGINSALVECSVLVQLLIDHGLITRAEVERYETRLAEHYGTEITLA